GDRDRDEGVVIPDRGREDAREPDLEHQPGERDEEYPEVETHAVAAPPWRAARELSAGAAGRQVGLGSLECRTRSSTSPRQAPRATRCGAASTRASSTSAACCPTCPGSCVVRSSPSVCRWTASTCGSTRWGSRHWRSRSCWPGRSASPPRPHAGSSPGWG